MILKEDGYRKLEDSEQPVVGDLVVYRPGYNDPIAHIGAVASVSLPPISAVPMIEVLSQWGQDGEYLHPISDVPDIFGKLLEYYTDRKEP